MAPEVEAALRANGLVSGNFTVAPTEPRFPAYWRACTSGHEEVRWHSSEQNCWFCGRIGSYSEYPTPKSMGNEQLSEQREAV